MSLFSWFSRKPVAAKPRPAAAEQASGLLNADATVPLAGRQGRPLVEPAAPPDHAANRKNERMERRELLYTVVRDAMVRAGVLSASYKFKVLSLDQRGRQFLVMMDLAREYGGETARLSEIEALIAQTAKTRYDILVTAVYWRINDHVAVGIPQRGAAVPAAAGAAQPQRRPPMAPGPAAAAPAIPQPPARPVPAQSARVGVAAAPSRPVGPAGVPAPAAAATAPAPLLPARSAPAPAPTPAPRTPPRFEPIEADEVAAFKRALAQAGSASAVPAAAAQPGVPVRSGPMLPPTAAPSGFEDTEMPGADGPAPDLSNTQYGDLH